MKRKLSARKAQRATATKSNQHLPEWDQVFNKMQAEAEDRYPDGRLRVIPPQEPHGIQPSERPEPDDTVGPETTDEPSEDSEES